MFKVSFSSMGTFSSCPRKWRYRYIDKRVPLRDDPKLTFGKLIHKCLQVLWVDGPGAVVRYLTKNADNIQPIDAIRVAVMLHHYAPPFDQYEVIGTEVPFLVTLPNPATGRAMHGVRIVGFTDLLLREIATGRTIVHEIKHTTEDIIGFGPFWTRIAIDAQTALYKWAHSADGIMYDVLKRPQIKPSGDDLKTAALVKNPDLSVKELTEAKKLITVDEQHDAFRARMSAIIAEFPDRWYQWRPLWKSDQDITDANWDLYHKAQAMRTAVRLNAFPRCQGSCRGFWGTCSYLDVCTGRASLQDETMFTDRVKP